MKNITFLGFGAMGTRMAARLLDAGHTVTVWNRTAAAAAALVERGARAAAEGADAVIVMLRDDEASRAVWLDAETGAVHGLAPGALAIESSTRTPAWARQLGQAVADAGAAFLDAPVAGSLPQAEAGQLVHFVGGDPADVARAAPLLDTLGAARHPVGPTGQGMTVKLAVNAFFGVQVAALGELAGLLKRSGAEGGLDMLAGLPITSPALQATAAAIAERRFAPLFPIELVEKDLGYALTQAALVEAPLPATTRARTVFAEARDRGFGGDNIAGVAQLYL